MNEPRQHLIKLDLGGQPVEVKVYKDIREVQDAIAPPGVRSVLQANCTTHRWHPILCVCVDCGVTQEEVHFKDRRANDVECN
jgi:hypothetical protein